MPRTVLFASLLLAAAVAPAQELVRAAPEGDTPPVVFRLSADGDWIGASRADSDGRAPVVIVAPLQPAVRPFYPGALTIGGLFSFPVGDGPRVVWSGWLPTRLTVPRKSCRDWPRNRA
jgi:hypothetical protein